MARSSIDPDFRLLLTVYDKSECHANATLSSDVLIKEGECWASRVPFSSFRYGLKRLGNLKQYGDCSMTLYEDQDCKAELDHGISQINNAQTSKLCYSIVDNTHRPQSLVVHCKVLENVSRSSDLVWWPCLGIAVFFTAVLFGLAIFVNLCTDWLHEAEKSKARKS